MGIALYEARQQFLAIPGFTPLAAQQQRGYGGTSWVVALYELDEEEVARLREHPDVEAVTPAQEQYYYSTLDHNKGIQVWRDGTYDFLFGDDANERLLTYARERHPNRITNQQYGKRLGRVGWSPQGLIELYAPYMSSQSTEYDGEIYEIRRLTRTGGGDLIHISLYTDVDDDALPVVFYKRDDAERWAKKYSQLNFGLRVLVKHSRGFGGSEIIWDSHPDDLLPPSAEELFISGLEQMLG